MIITASEVKISGFTILSDGWVITVNGDRVQFMENKISVPAKMMGSYETFAYNTISSFTFKMVP